MTQERKTQVATIAVLAAALGVVLAQKSGWRPSSVKVADIVLPAAAKAEPSPQDAIYAMLDAARAGDVQTYLASYTGEMAVALKQSLAETTDAGFAKYLKDTNAAVKGVAISESQAVTDREVKVRVEYVYQDRNEAQMMYLEKSSTGWKIARVDGAERVKTLVPYGTPVQ